MVKKDVFQRRANVKKTTLAWSAKDLTFDLKNSAVSLVSVVIIMVVFFNGSNDH